MRPSILQTAIPSLADRAISRYIERVAYALTGRFQNAPLRPVIAHCMSNAGWIAFGTLICLLNQNRERIRTTQAGKSRQGNANQSFFEILQSSLCGIVVDSAPSLATPSIWSRGMLSAMLEQPVDTLDAKHPVAVQCATRLAEQYLALPSVHRRLMDVRKAWESRTTNTPQLYLYSSRDPLIPLQQVESFIEQQKLLASSPIMSHCWSDSGHCEHLRHHPEEYHDRVSTFIEQCLRNFSSNLHVAAPNDVQHK